MHELVKEEIEKKALHEWPSAMERSFTRMDKEVNAWNQGAAAGANCRCELQMPECEAVGSTAVVAIVTPDKIIVANCGDSRAVLCRNGKAVPLSSDHKVIILFTLVIICENGDWFEYTVYMYMALVRLFFFKFKLLLF